MPANPACGRKAQYLPALKYRSLTPVYDPVLRWLFREGVMKTRLVERIRLRPGQRLLDVGCGTGTLTIMLKRAQPEAVIVGLDGDPAVLEIARGKTAEAGVDVAWDEGHAQLLPYLDGSFDAVVASLVLHHLAREEKARALREVHRVLRPGGSVYLADFGRPQNAVMGLLARVSELLEETADGVEGRLPGMFRAAGLRDVEELDRFMTPLGTIVVFHARKSRPRGR